MKYIMLTALLTLMSSLASAKDLTPKEFRFKSITTYEVPMDSSSPVVDQTNSGIGDIIKIGEDLVALGEKIYALVEKGRPTVTTTYAPINVVPRDPTTRQFVMPDELEGTSAPVTRKYVTVVKNYLNMEVVKFEYMLMFSHSGSYNGRGKFIQNAVIIPMNVHAVYGWVFNATMRVIGVSNEGTTRNPIAATTIAMNYSIKSIGTAIDRTQVISLTGAGGLKVE